MIAPAREAARAPTSRTNPPISEHDSDALTRAIPGIEPSGMIV